VILDADPTAVPSADILRIAVVETFKEGKSVFRAVAA
jgi:predicted amidohydrolase YtcJ